MFCSPPALAVPGMCLVPAVRHHPGSAHLMVSTQRRRARNALRTNDFLNADIWHVPSADGRPARSSSSVSQCRVGSAQFFACIGADGVAVVWGKEGVGRPPPVSLKRFQKVEASRRPSVGLLTGGQNQRFPRHAAALRRARRRPRRPSGSRRDIAVACRRGTVRT